MYVWKKCTHCIQVYRWPETMAMRALWFLVRANLDALRGDNFVETIGLVIFVLILAIHLSLVFHRSHKGENESIVAIHCHWSRDLYRYLSVISKVFEVQSEILANQQTSERPFSRWNCCRFVIDVTRRRTFRLEWFILEPRYNVSFSQKFVFLLTFYLRVLTRTVCEIYRDRERNSNEISRDKTWRFR